MRIWLLVAQLLAQAIPTAVMPSAPPRPAVFTAAQDEGRWAHVTGHVCWRGEDQLDSPIIKHACSCKMLCPWSTRPNADCVTYCATEQCLCHPDEACEMDMVPEPKR